jgi:nickel/cobalt exporter
MITHLHDRDPDHDHDNDHHDHSRGAGPMNAHALAHARQIEARVGSGQTTLLQTILFGLTGGLIPCPAAITVLLLCLNLGQFALGVTLVAGFSIGLAVTLVVVGTLAAVGMQYAAARTSRFNALLTYLPYVSSALIGLVGLLMIYTGWMHLQHQVG